MKNNLHNNKVEIMIFSFFTIYFLIWSKTNYHFVNINNNSLEEALNFHKFNPYISFYLFKFFDIFNLNYILGYVVTPSLVAVAIYKIFYKILNSKLWAISIMLLSMTGSESFPFINFLKSIFNFDVIMNTVNTRENFEIMGFPIPSFSILYFCILYYFSFEFIKIKEKNIILLSFFWIIGPLVHPLDGLLGLFFWDFFILILIKIRKINLNRKVILFIIINNLIMFFLVFKQITVNHFFLTTSQDYSIYNFIIYFLLPIVFILICFLFLKIDLYEFNQKFLSIYLFMLVELILIIFSVNGLGVDLKMLETRVSMFFLHFLYYAPVIYYLNRDNFFLIKKNTKYSLSNFFSYVLILIFKKLNKIYLPAFSILIIIYFILSLRI